MRKFLGGAVVAMALAVAGGAMAECYTGWQSPSVDEYRWEIIYEDDEPFAVSDEYPWIKLPLYMQAPSKPKILSFERGIGDSPMVSSLVYYAGSPGTSVIIPITERIVFDMSIGGEVLLRGSVMEGCDPVDWSLNGDVLSVDDPAIGYQEVVLP
jgi:hypothetical protein